jgi:hypothetical protein
MSGGGAEQRTSRASFSYKSAQQQAPIVREFWHRLETERNSTDDSGGSSAGVLNTTSIRRERRRFDNGNNATIGNSTDDVDGFFDSNHRPFLRPDDDASASSNTASTSIADIPSSSRLRTATATLPA